MLAVPELLQRIPVLEKAFQEQLVVIREVMRHAGDILKTDESVPKQFRVTLNPLPDNLLTFPLNMISSTFLGVLYALGVPTERRMLYGKLNHLFRAWVTSADNLLDGEDKVTFPVHMPGNAAVMRQVIVIMLADRIMNRLFAEAQAEHVLSEEEARTLSDESLRVLLPSAAEEASEEGGVTEWPNPDYVLDQIHPLKTGILFQLPFLGPEKIERKIDPEQLVGMKSALLNFAIACQMLDDIRDMARDFSERRANYVISSLAHGRGGAQAEEVLRHETQGGDLDKRLDHLFPGKTRDISKAAVARLHGAFAELDRLGISGFGVMAPGFTATLLTRMDLPHLIASE